MLRCITVFILLLALNTIAGCENESGDGKNGRKAQLKSFPIHEAIDARNLEALAQAIDAGHDLNAIRPAQGRRRMYAGATPLMLAASNDWPEGLELILTNDADVNASDANGTVALHLAAASNGSTECLALLLAYDAAVGATNKWGGQAIHHAAWNQKNNSIELAAILIVADADPDHATHYGITPLIAAIEHDNVAIASMLLATDGVRPDVAIENGMTPLLLAAERGHGDLCFDLALAGANLQRTNLHIRRSALHLAAARDDQADPVMLANLIDAGIAADVTDATGRTPLMLMSSGASRACFLALLDGGADINAADHNGLTALHLALLDSDPDLVVRLLEFGADPTINDNQGRTAMTLFDFVKKQHPSENWDVVQFNQ